MAGSANLNTKQRQISNHQNQTRSSLDQQSHGALFDMEKEMNNCNGPIVKQIPITYKTKNKLYTQQLTTVVHLGLLKGSMELL